jgi:hypothetical protein
MHGLYNIRFLWSLFIMNRNLMWQQWVDMEGLLELVFECPPLLKEVRSILVGKSTLLHVIVLSNVVCYYKFRTHPYLVLRLKTE